MFCKKRVLRKFAKFTEKHLRQNLILKKRTLAQVFFCELCKISIRTPFLTEHLWWLLLYIQQLISYSHSYDFAKVNVCNVFLRFGNKQTKLWPSGVRFGLCQKFMITSEGVVRRCSSKQVSVKNFENFKGKHLCWSLFLIKSQVYKQTPAQVLSFENCKNFKNNFFQKTPPVAKYLTVSRMRLRSIFYKGKKVSLGQRRFAILLCIYEEKKRCNYFDIYQISLNLE